MSTPETPTPAAGTDATNGTNGTAVDPTAVDPTVVPADLQDERLIASQGFGGWASATWGRLRSGDLGSLPVVVGLVLIWGVFYALEPAFLSSRNLVNLTLQMRRGRHHRDRHRARAAARRDRPVGRLDGRAVGGDPRGDVRQRRRPRSSSPSSRPSAPGRSSGCSTAPCSTASACRASSSPSPACSRLLGLQLRVLGDQGTDQPAVRVEPRAASRPQQFLPAWRRLRARAHRPGGLRAQLPAPRRRRAEAGLSTRPGDPARAARRRARRDPRRRRRRAQPRPRRLLHVPDLPRSSSSSWTSRSAAPGGAVRCSPSAATSRRHVAPASTSSGSTCRSSCCARPSPRSAASSPRRAWPSANQSSGGGDTNLNAIAAAVIGGTSLFGGRGSAYSALLGILVIQSISNGLDLLAVESQRQVHGDRRACCCSPSSSTA